MKNLASLLATAAASVFAATATAEPLTVGAALPSVEQKNQDDQPIKLAEAGAKGYTLVYFYPKADTPGCTKQACSLRDSYEQLTQKGVKVFGVSMDKVPAQKAFKEKYRLPFTLIADTDSAVINAFGVPAAMPLTGMAHRSAYLIKDGKIVYTDYKGTTEKQAETILAELGKPSA